MRRPAETERAARVAAIRPRRRRLAVAGASEQTPTILQMEAVECGAAALAMVLAYHGAGSRSSSCGSHAACRATAARRATSLRAARRFGLAAKGFRKEPATLHELPMPCIIHWNFNHFVVLEGFDGERAYINDPGGRPPPRRHGGIRRSLHRRRAGDGAGAGFQRRGPQAERPCGCPRCANSRRSKTGGRRCCRLSASRSSCPASYPGFRQDLRRRHPDPAQLAAGSSRC